MNTAQKNNYDLKRARLIKLVHIAANELGLLDPKRHETDPEDEYHLILRRWNRPGTRQPVTSSTQMGVGQLDELLIFLKGLGFKIKSNKPSSAPSPSSAVKTKYASSLQGLKDEICDLAKSRFGESWELPLNNFCLRFGVKRWQWLDVSHGKAVKGVLLRLQSAIRIPQSEIDTPEVPF